MSTVFDEYGEQEQESIRLCYEIFGADEAKDISMRVPRAPAPSKRTPPDDDPPSDIYIA